MAQTVGLSETTSDGVAGVRLQPAKRAPHYADDGRHAAGHAPGLATSAVLTKLGAGRPSRSADQPARATNLQLRLRARNRSIDGSQSNSSVDLKFALAMSDRSAATKSGDS